jgi:hypothetical protein
MSLLSPRRWTFRDSLSDGEYELRQLATDLDDAGHHDAAEGVRWAAHHVHLAFMETPKNAVDPKATT